MFKFRLLDKKDYAYNIWNYLYFSNIDNLLECLDNSLLVSLSIHKAMKKNQLILLSDWDRHLLCYHNINLKEILSVKKQLENLDLYDLKNLLLAIQYSQSPDTLMNLILKILKKLLPLTILYNLIYWGITYFNIQLSVITILNLILFILIIIFHCAYYYYLIYIDLTKSHKKKLINQLLPELLKEIISEKETKR